MYSYKLSNKSSLKESDFMPRKKKTREQEEEEYEEEDW